MKPHPAFPPLQWSTDTAQQTAALGEQLAASLPPRADAAVVVYLSGDLGAGKTTLAQGFVRACGVKDPVRSPTYTLVEIYEGPRVTVLHLDLYRLRDQSELGPLGLRDWAKSPYVWLVEWPEKGGALLPAADIHIKLTVADGEHEIQASAPSAFGRQWLAAVPKA